VCLKEFYYPTKIRVEKELVQLESLAELPENGKIVVQGTAGQGKSILLRYLTGTELRKSVRLPIFVELRKISDTKSLIDLILDNLNEMGLAINAEELPYLFDTGKCVLLLDAFDEIPEAKTTEVITLIEDLRNKHHNLFVLLSSRPGAGIQKVSYMRVFDIAELQSDDFESLLCQLFPDSRDNVEAILKAIENSETQIKELLTTPLLLTMLVFIYKSYNDIPKTLSEFYEKLFYILSSRHDATKPGFRREFATQLPESELAKLFDAFCFFCMKAKKSSLKREEAIDLVCEAKQYAEKDDVNEQDFLKDITKVTCLLVEEGFEYHFIHKTIR
jgi:predicted NACHT family NTPase